MRQDEEWKAAAAELGFHVGEWTDLGRPKELAGQVDGYWVRVYPYAKGGEFSATVSMAEIRFPEEVGPPGLRMRIRRPSWLALGLSRVRKRRGWSVFTDTEKSRVVQARAADPDQLAHWMTPDRVDALASLRTRPPRVEVSPERLRIAIQMDATARWQEIVSEVRHLISVAKRLAD